MLSWLILGLLGGRYNTALGANSRCSSGAVSAAGLVTAISSPGWTTADAGEFALILPLGAASLCFSHQTLSRRWRHLTAT